MSIFLLKCHNTISTLSHESNPSHVWGTYAPGRALAFIFKNFASQTIHLLYILRVSHLVNLHTLLHKEPLAYSMILYSKSIYLQLSPRIMTGPAKPHTRHSNHSNEIVMEDITPTSKRTSPHATKSSHKKTKSNSSIISLYRDPSQMEFWYGYPIMETIAYEAGIPPIPIFTSLEELIATGYVTSEAAELCSASISFPRV